MHVLNEISTIRNGNRITIAHLLTSGTDGWNGGTSAVPNLNDNLISLVAALIATFFDVHFDFGKAISNGIVNLRFDLTENAILRGRFENVTRSRCFNAKTQYGSTAVNIFCFTFGFMIKFIKFRSFK